MDTLNISIEAQMVVTKEKMAKIMENIEALQKENVEQGKSSMLPCPLLLTTTLEKDVEVKAEKNQQHAQVNNPFKLVALYPNYTGAVARIGT